MSEWKIKSIEYDGINIMGLVVFSILFGAVSIRLILANYERVLFTYAFTFLASGRYPHQQARGKGEAAEALFRFTERSNDEIRRSYHVVRLHEALLALCRTKEKLQTIVQCRIV